MLDSVAEYKQQIALAASQGAEIIVFPEYGITGLSVPSTREAFKPYLQVLPSVTPDPLQPWTPCFDSTVGFNATVLHELSCVAAENKITVVANTGTLVQCDATGQDPSCPDDGAYQFNTDIVFAENGTIIMTYHKVNLYMEPTFNKPPYSSDFVAKFSTAKTTFGLITCFDILWQYPLITIIEDYGIQNILMPTAWVDGLPFLTSVQSQEAWAVGLNINLLSANIQNSKDGYRGSGIYSGSLGFLNYTYSSDPKSVLLNGEVPVQPGLSVSRINSPSSTSFVNYTGIIYDDLSVYSFKRLNADLSADGSVQVASGNISCQVSFSFSKPVDSGDYVLAAYQGKTTLGYGNYVLAIEVCSVLWCEDPDQPANSCSRISPATASADVKTLNLTASFTTSYVYPNILRSDLQLVDKSKWIFKKIGASCELSTLANFSENVLVASLYGRRCESSSRYSWPPRSGKFYRVVDDARDSRHDT